jgi:hypothetical protein
MEQKNELILSPGIADVVNQFERWRQTRISRREPIPEQLWQAAVQLAGRYSINKISKALRLNYTDLKNHVHGRTCKKAIKPVQSTAFIELDCKNPFWGSECIIEMENKDGSRMKWHLKGSMELDLLKLGKTFWSKG